MWWWTSPTSKALPRMRSDTPGATTTMTRAAFLLGKFLLHRGSLHVSVCRHPKPPFFCLLSELLCLFLCSLALAPGRFPASGRLSRVCQPAVQSGAPPPRFQRIHSSRNWSEVNAAASRLRSVTLDARCSSRNSTSVGFLVLGSLSLSILDQRWNSINIIQVVRPI